MDKKYQIFISSTYMDLIDERKAVQEAILFMYHFPVGMELFSASGTNQWEIIKSTLDNTDYYVLIIGKKYGTVIPDGYEDAGISYTEKEYNYAKAKNIPVLAFIIDNNVPLSEDKFESDSVKREKLQAFIKRVQDNQMVEWWDKKENLVNKVITALNKEFTRSPQIGWIRGNSQSEIQEHKHNNNNRKPLFKVSLRVDKEDNSKNKLYQNSKNGFDNENGGITIKKKIVKKEIPQKFTQKLSLLDVPIELRKYVTEESIHEYNNNLPNERTVKNFSDKMMWYEIINNCGVPVYFYIDNIGTLKATNVNIELEFPKELCVYNIEDAAAINMPTVDFMPENPIVKAREKSEIAYNVFSSSIFSQPRMESICSTIGYRNIADFDNFHKAKVFDKNSAEGIFPSIMHTKGDYLDGIYIVPLKEGKYQVKCYLICEEIEEKQECIIDVIVENIA